MEKGLWLDTRTLNDKEVKELVPLALNNGYDGVLFTADKAYILDMLPNSVKALLYVEKKDLEASKEIIKLVEKKNYIIFTNDEEVFSILKGKRFGLYYSVNDRESLDYVVKKSDTIKDIIIEFKDTTNIPLELVLAFSQKNKCSVCKKVDDSKDGWIASMVMEMGSHSVLLSTKNPHKIIELKKEIQRFMKKNIKIKELTVTEVEHIGMGDRVCVDTTSLLKEDEGMILGSSSSGGVLVSSETHYLPYMELRPFRVNAGGLHMYAWCQDDVTKYLSELRAGSQVMVVDSQGSTREVAVGRIKMERRPLLLIKAIDESNIEVNTIIQDDWHVRIVGPKGKPLNSTELKTGDKILGYTGVPGRHVGIKIDEQIIEK